jgi:putative flavoprotein involved in K+ transport
MCPVPVFDTDGEPAQRRGIVDTQPGLYFLGRLFQYSLASSMIHGVGRDAEHIARHIAARMEKPGAHAPATNSAFRDD